MCLYIGPGIRHLPQRGAGAALNYTEWELWFMQFTECRIDPAWNSYLLCTVWNGGKVLLLASTAIVWFKCSIAHLSYNVLFIKPHWPMNISRIKMAASWREEQVLFLHIIDNLAKNNFSSQSQRHELLPFLLLNICTNKVIPTEMLAENFRRSRSRRSRRPHFSWSS